MHIKNKIVLILLSVYSSLVSSWLIFITMTSVDSGLGGVIGSRDDSVSCDVLGSGNDLDSGANSDSGDEPGPGFFMIRVQLMMRNFHPL